MLSWGIHWFRRDLRITGNGALAWSWKKHQGRVLGVFCFDPAFLSRPDFSVDRFAFFLKSLEALREEMRAAGGDLLVLDHGPQAAFPALLEKIARYGQPKPGTISWNRDYEPFARARDSWAQEYFEQTAGLEVHTQRDHLLIEPAEVVNASGSRAYYSVYSPFARRWFEALHGPEVQSRILEQAVALKRRGGVEKQGSIFELRWEKRIGAHEDVLARYLETITAQARVPLPAAGHAAALAAVDAFAAKVSDYKEQRDFPDRSGTSRLSIYLKNGSITSAQVLARLRLEKTDFKAKGGAAQFVRELAWREFYYHILWHCPSVETLEFQSHFRGLAWENNPDYFEAWKTGRTGYPIVDAAMRELNQTGWMHNRARMIVASFLTKDLLIDWRWGERYFMERLLDGDLAPNNGGWQWAASTGCDAQPYFRIFNPELQSRKFDPEGAYIRSFVPELAQMTAKEIHAPALNRMIGTYYAPIVDHRERRDAALKLYKIALVIK